MTTARTRLWLVRHGQIAANLTGHWHGWTDSPLTDTGRTQVTRVAGWFADAAHPVAAVYTSPLQRTHDTARGIASALGLEAEPVLALREYGIGELEGTPYKALRDEHRFFDRIRDEPDWAPAGGESLRDVVTRMHDTFTDISARHAGEDVVLVSHGAAMALTIAHLLHADALEWGQYHVSNCSVSEFCLMPEPALGMFNSTAHLEGEDA
ncbi:MAG TPA: histidine phosphatase family protein [Pseudomonadales bacterium]|nr:histidine phosphatase family protein [Pseudomonadales bacterium]